MMKGTYQIFDYFKKAFHINRHNKDLYKPQIILIIIKLLMIIGIGVELFIWLGRDDFYRLIRGDIKLTRIFPVVFSVGAGLIAVIAIYIILSHIVEAGLYNMYKQCVTVGSSVQEDFWEGVRKYFFNFLFGDLLIFAAWIVFLPFYFIAGMLTLTVGFAVIPIIINIFLTMWKVSLVMNDSTLFTAIGDSFKFAKKHFFPLTVLQLIHWSFIKAGGGFGGNIGNTSRWTQRADKISPPFGPDNVSPSFDSGFIPNQQEVLENVIKVVRIVIAVLTPVIAVAAAIGALIKMIFEIFFSLVIFIAYNDGFNQLQQLAEGEVLP